MKRNSRRPVKVILKKSTLGSFPPLQYQSMKASINWRSASQILCQSTGSSRSFPFISLQGTFAPIPPLAWSSLQWNIYVWSPKARVWFTSTHARSTCYSNLYPLRILYCLHPIVNVLFGCNHIPISTSAPESRNLWNPKQHWGWWPGHSFGGGFVFEGRLRRSWEFLSSSVTTADQLIWYYFSGWGNRGWWWFWLAAVPYFCCNFRWRLRKLAGVRLGVRFVRTICVVANTGTVILEMRIAGRVARVDRARDQLLPRAHRRHRVARLAESGAYCRAPCSTLSSHTETRRSTRTTPSRPPQPHTRRSELRAPPMTRSARSRLSALTWSKRPEVSHYNPPRTLRRLRW